MNTITDSAQATTRPSIGDMPTSLRAFVEDFDEFEPATRECRRQLRMGHRWLLDLPLVNRRGQA